MKTGGENLQQVYNPGLDFILNTYGSAENIIPSKNVVPILSRGIVIEVDFNNRKNYKLAAAVPPFSVYAKIIGEGLDVAQPQLQTEKIFFAPLFPMNNLSIPEIGEEVLILRESNEISSNGFYIGRVNNTPGLGYYPARQYMDDQNSTTNSEFKYGFSFEADKLRAGSFDKLPSDEFEIMSIPLTYGDVVQQGRSQTYIRHSFNKNNKKGVLEQGLCLQKQNSGKLIQYNLLLNTGFSNDPSIGKTATKTIHFVDTSIKRLGDFSLKSKVFEYPDQNNLNSSEDKSMIVNMADEIYDISTRSLDTTLYRQVLGEKLVSHQQETNALIGAMLNGLTGLAQTTQVLLDAFIEHTHALPKIELNLSTTAESKDLYSTPTKFIPQGSRMAWIRKPSWNKVPRAAKTVWVPGYFDHYAPDGGAYVEGHYNSRPQGYDWKRDPGLGVRVPTPPRAIPGRIRTRTVKQKINFDAIIGGAENPRFTAPIETDTEILLGTILPGESFGPRRGLAKLLGPGGQIFGKTELGLKTDEVDNNSAELIESFNIQQDNLINIIDKASDFLSRNQFIN